MQDAPLQLYTVSPAVRERSLIMGRSREGGGGSAKKQGGGGQVKFYPYKQMTRRKKF